MPKLSVWFIRASMVYMGIGFLFGSLLLHHKGVPTHPWTFRLLNPHIEVMIFGWTMQFVMGITFWILPRFSGEGRYGNAALGWWSFGLLNIGILSTAFGAWFMLDVLSLLGRLCVLVAVGLFVIVMWPRVKPLGGAASAKSS